MPRKRTSNTSTKSNILPTPSPETSKTTNTKRKKGEDEPSTSTSPSASGTKKRKSNSSASSSGSGASAKPSTSFVPKPWHLEVQPKIVEKLFQDVYVIPDYQRPYAWEVKNIIDLLKDIHDEYKQQKQTSSYFIGSIVLKQPSVGERKQVIDGQQRLISLSIILAMIRHCLKAWSPIDIQECSTISHMLVDTVYHHGGRIQVLNDRGVANTNDTFFHKYVLQEGGFEQMLNKVGKKSIDLKICNMDGLIQDLEEKKIVYSATAINCATNYIHVFHKLKKYFQENCDELINFFKFFTKNCVVVAIEVPADADEMNIFGTLNLRGKDLSPMDKLKLDFGVKFSCSMDGGFDETENELPTVAHWNKISQELGEEDFTLLFETIYQLKHTPTNVKTKERNYVGLFEEIVEDIKQHYSQNSAQEFLGSTFMKHYMQPLFVGSQSRFSHKRPECFKANMNIQKCLSRINFIADNYLPKDQKQSSNIVVSILLAMIICHKTHQKFMTFDISELNQGLIEKLITLWHNHVMLVCLCDTGKVKFKDMMKEIQSILKGPKRKTVDAEVEKLLLKGKSKGADDKVDFTKWEEKIQRQVHEGSTSERDKKQTSRMMKVFEIILPIINDHLGNTSEKEILYDPSWKIVKIFRESQSKRESKDKKIGNFTLVTAKQKDEAKKLSTTDLIKKLQKKNGLIINNSSNLPQQFNLDECEERTEMFIETIRAILDLRKN
ncbi:hypothetical protein C9374_007649 [Naegleria lovaniensis]|uniref:GmrSD restriction endonucleases N-terminal domain-containing protein n=1 Tax=Naegleria lovaniensis TaxID=51637 RepID=A0AA88GM74_NAELO|nr:uncharacterized protein C9374_007649 [Naegleria lovaniensis]KAG2379011.1 hypothetical protein C9374_007649 [Naegleria lovaniensis]